MSLIAITFGFNFNTVTQKTFDVVKTLHMVNIYRNNVFKHQTKVMKTVSAYLLCDVIAQIFATICLVVR